MNRRAFIASLAVLPVAACAGPAFARHETIDLTAHVGLHVENGKLIATVERINSDEVIAALRSMRGGDLLTIRLNGETIGTVEA